MRRPDEHHGVLDSFRQQPMTDEAAAFMYMQLALEEMRAGTP